MDNASHFIAYLDLNRKRLIDDIDNQNTLIDANVITRENLDLLINYYNIFNEIYPNECDLQICFSEENDDYHYVIVIHFPELTVTNSRNESHKIYDFFFAVCFDNQLNINRFRGNRTTMMLEEIDSNYKFSHLSREGFDTIPIYTNFCFGDGDIPKLRLKFNSSVQEERFQILTLIAYSIEIYLSWESLEGGPYKRMAEIFNKSSKYLQFSGIVSIRSAFGAIISSPTRLSRLKLNIIYSNNRYIVADDKLLNDSLLEICESFSYSTRKYIILLQDDNGELYLSNNGNMNNNIRNLSNVPIIFQGREYRYRICNSPTFTNQNQRVINPTLKEYVRKYIEFEFNSKISTTNIIKRFQNKIALGQEY